MRISTKTIFDTATSQLGTLQSQIARTQQQLSTNRRLLSAADDPVASARALEVTQSQSMNEQFKTNRQNANSSLSLVDETLKSTTGQLQDVQSLVVSAGNASFSDSDRASLAIELEGRFSDLLGLANTGDGSGGYLFSGYKTDTQPFVQSAAGAQYYGDQGQRQLQVASSRKMPISASGSAIFENNLTGNGTFETQAAGANTGSGVISAGAVADVTKLTGHDYAIAFSVPAAPGVTTYTITDTTTGNPVPAPPAPAAQPYTPGQQIAFDGMAFDIKGAPANGDSFTVKPSQKQSLFATVTNLIAALRTPADDAKGRALLSNNLTTAGANLKAALDNVLSVQASVGARQKELDYLDGSGEDLNIQYASTLSTLQDLDTAKAISSFSQQQLTLQAAQQSFKAMSGLSLFNYIG
jgi:flagellar hook-associated protein 3 FlgL